MDVKYDWHLCVGDGSWNMCHGLEEVEVSEIFAYVLNRWSPEICWDNRYSMLVS